MNSLDLHSCKNGHFLTTYLNILNTNHWKSDVCAHTHWHAFGLLISHDNVGRNNVLAISRMPGTLICKI